MFYGSDYKMKYLVNHEKLKEEIVDSWVDQLALVLRVPSNLHKFQKETLRETLFCSILNLQTCQMKNVASEKSYLHPFTHNTDKCSVPCGTEDGEEQMDEHQNTLRWKWGTVFTEESFNVAIQKHTRVKKSISSHTHTIKNCFRE